MGCFSVLAMTPFFEPARGAQRTISATMGFAVKSAGQPASAISRARCRRSHVTLKRLAMICAAGALFIGLAKAETFVADLELEDGGSQRVLYAAPEKPRAAL